MNKFISDIGIIVALVFGTFVLVFLNTTTVVRAPSSATIPNASSTIPVIIPPVATSTSEIPVPEKTIPPEKNTQPKAIPAPVSVPASSPIVAPSPVASLSVSLDASSSALRNALVNIICYAPSGSGLQSISASGVVIDSKGIILTNAHVAQYFLLADRNVSCTIRSGSPATSHYNAALIYISPEWLKANATVLTESLPNGTGENDFAFLAISRSTTHTPLPSSFPFVPLATMPPDAGTPVVIASYGAQFLESSQIQSFLFPTIVIGSVKAVFTFRTNTIDALALGGSVAAQEGSSGGGVIDSSGELVGTITTSTVSGATDTRSLSAITASYIRAQYANETGNALDLLLGKPTATSIANFAPDIPALESIVTSQLH